MVLSMNAVSVRSITMRLVEPMRFSTVNEFVLGGQVVLAAKVHDPDVVGRQVGYADSRVGRLAGSYCGWGSRGGAVEAPPRDLAS